MALVQPRERGGKRQAQRYHQRTPAMAAGRTTRRWTARDVLCSPLPPVPCSACPEPLLTLGAPRNGRDGSVRLRADEGGKRADEAADQVG
jgi:hypothetical protein